MHENYTKKKVISLIEKITWGILFSLIFVFTEAPAQRVLKAHSHNDYNQSRPLYTALNLNFKSIEADVVLRNKKLYVAHSADLIDSSKTLENMYLKPLSEIFKRRKGKIYEGTSLILLVDIKSDAEESYAELKKELEKYAELLVNFKNRKKSKGSVEVIISGNRPIETIRNEKDRFAAIDGRKNILDMNEDSNLFPLISEDWHTFTQSLHAKNSGELNSLIKKYISKAHKQSKLIRFWNTPDNPEQWQLLLELKVDLINTDKLSELADFLMSKKYK